MMNRPDDALKDLVRARRRRPARRAAVAGAGLCAAGPLGQGARHVQDHGGGDGDFADRTAARRAARTTCAPPSRSAISTPRPTTSTISRPSASRTRWSRPLAVLMGRLAEGLGRKEDALAAYRTAADSLGSAGGGAGPVARDRAALSARRSQARRRDLPARIADHDLARRRDRDRSAQGAGASLHRGRPLSRRLLCHAQRHGGAPGFGADPADPGRGRGDLRRAVPHQQGRHACRRSTRWLCSTISASSPRSALAATR